MIYLKFNDSYCMGKLILGYPMVSVEKKRAKAFTEAEAEVFKSKCNQTLTEEEVEVTEHA